MNKCEKFKSFEGVEIAFPDLSNIKIGILSKLSSLNKNSKINEVLPLFEKLLSKHDYKCLENLTVDDFARYIRQWINYKSKNQNISLGE
jgi:hypothetical protein